MANLVAKIQQFEHSNIRKLTIDKISTVAFYFRGMDGFLLQYFDKNEKVYLDILQWRDYMHDLFLRGEESFKKCEGC